MRKYTWLIAILVVAMLAVTFMAGCGKKQESSSVVSTGSPSAGTAASPTTAPAKISTLADLIKKQGGLSSYIMTMDMGQMKMRTAMKMEGGKPVAMKVDMGPQGWMLMRVDKKMQYMYNPQTKGVMGMPISDTAMASAQKDPLAQLKAMAGAKVSSDTVDGVDCLKVVSGQGTFWCEKENGLPVQAQVMGKLMKFKYEQINSVADSEFELPAGTKVQTMPAMPNMPKAPK